MNLGSSVRKVLLFLASQSEPMSTSQIEHALGIGPCNGQVRRLTRDGLAEVHEVQAAPSDLGPRVRPAFAASAKGLILARLLEKAPASEPPPEPQVPEPLPVVEPPTALELPKPAPTPAPAPVPQAKVAAKPKPVASPKPVQPHDPRPRIPAGDVASRLAAAAECIPRGFTQSRKLVLPERWPEVRRLIAGLPDAERRACLLELLRDEGERLAAEDVVAFSRSVKLAGSGGGRD